MGGGYQKDGKFTDRYGNAIIKHQGLTEVRSSLSLS